MTTLPKITPRSTPRSISAPQSQSMSAVAMLYGAYPPSELTSTWDPVKFPSRVNPLSPPPPKRRINSSWETVTQHHHNDKRRLAMQQREHERYHSAWAKPFYGPPADKEAYRRHFRQVLKQQMTDLDSKKAHELQSKVAESTAAVEYDNQCKTKDYNDNVKKFRYLKTFRDDNKYFMEEAWQNTRHSKVMTDRYDRELMRYNPINWSGTLK